MEMVLNPLRLFSISPLVGCLTLKPLTRHYMKVAIACSSPRDSNASDDDSLILSPRSGQEGEARRGLSAARRSKRVGRQPLKLMQAESDEVRTLHSEDMHTYHKVGYLLAVLTGQLQPPIEKEAELSPILLNIS